MDLSTRPGRREQGQRIQRAVERANLSIEELATRIGCSRALIYQYLSGTTLAQPDRLQQIARETGVPLIYFYGDSPDEPPVFGSPATTPAAAQTTATPIPGATAPDSAPVATPPPAPTATIVNLPPPSPAQEVAARLSDSLRSLEELAQAQESPADYRALASTCERILSLSAQLGDRQAQATAQFRLGNALLRISDYPRAAAALTRAVALAQEAGFADRESESRQGLGLVLLSLGRTSEAREQFTRVAQGPSFSGRWKGTISLGSIDTLHGDYRQALNRYDEATTILEEGEISGQATSRQVAIGLLYVNMSRCTVYINSGDFVNARTLANKGVADAESLGIADQYLEGRFDIAWCDLCVGQWAGAYRGLTTLLRLARFVGDQGRETLSRAWLGIFHAGSGDFDTAISEGKDALALALSRGDRRAELYAQLALANAYIGQTHRDSEARYHANQALAVATSLRHDRGEIECRLYLARIGVQIGELAEAQEAANRAVTLAQRLGARHLESLGHFWLSQALAHETKNADISSEERDRAQSEAEAALTLAQEIGFVETQWRAYDFLAQLALASQKTTAASLPDDLQIAETHLRAAITILDGLRASLAEAGLADTLLENEDCRNVYARMARLLRQSGRVNEYTTFLDAIAWPPLSASLEAE